MVSIGIMNKQINLRLPQDFIKKALVESKNQGYSSLQEFIKDILREKIYVENSISNQELELVKKLVEVSEEKSLYGSEKELFNKLG